MRRCLFAGFLMALAIAFTCCQNKKEVVKDSAQQIEIVNDTTQVGDSAKYAIPAEEAKDLDEKQIKEYHSLVDVVDKYTEPDFDMSNLTQADYEYMIKFCNSVMTRAREADLVGESDKYMKESADALDLVKDFSSILASAYNAGMLNETNKAAVERLRERANK